MYNQVYSMIHTFNKPTSIHSYVPSQNDTSQKIIFPNKMHVLVLP
jgi:hypothetical protein